MPIPNTGRLAASLLVVAALVSLGACADTHEGLMDESLDSMDELSEILSGITDEASAKAAVSDLEDWADDNEDLQKRIKALGDPTDEDKKVLEEGQKKFMEAAGRVIREIGRIGANPKLRPHLEEVMKRVTDAMG